MEDAGHEAFIPGLFFRLLREQGVDSSKVDFMNLSSRGGKSLEAFEQFIKDTRNAPHLRGDLLIVGSDADSSGFQSRRKYISEKSQQATYSKVVPVIPVPYIERWYLLDIRALSSVSGLSLGQVSLSHPGDKHYYKTLLRKVLAENTPPLGGIEYGPDLVEKMDLYLARKQDVGLDHFISEVTAWVKGNSERFDSLG